MTEKEKKKNAQEFSEYWEGRGYEKGESQPFWMSLLRDVFEIEHPEKYIKFEDQVHLDHTAFIDGYIDETRVLIEQKGRGKDLNKPIRQSDGSLLTPFQQAKRYITELPVSRHPRWVVTCNFQSFYVYDMEQPNGTPAIIELKNLKKEYYRLNFLIDKKSENVEQEMEISFKAGELVGEIYNALKKQYINPDSEESLHSLNKLCVRLVFCLYAEDSGIFGRHNIFYDYMNQFTNLTSLRTGLIELFKVLNTKEEERDPYLDGIISEFPYVNGGLFEDDIIEIPTITDEIRDVLLNKASKEFDWSEISPTIFGAVFESTLNPETRRTGGMHYTSIENIHKVIDNLFLNELNSEYEEIMSKKVVSSRKKELEALQNKLATLTFLDPACGSGNFLTETYISLRRLENKIISAIYDNQMFLGEYKNPVKVNISQFYGIEVNDFAVTVAKTALWIAESQMLEETSKIVYANIDFLPLKTNASIIEANSITYDWNDLVRKSSLNYIMGNPPFHAARRMSEEQHRDMNYIAKDFPKNGELDYVACWYIKAALYMKNTRIKAGFVSTSSICQGEQVSLLWKKLFNDYDLDIFYAIRSFNWVSEASKKAGVHCIIIEFTIGNQIKDKIIEENGIKHPAKHINGYLINYDDKWIENRKAPICDVPTISNGSKPLDNAICAFTTEEKDDFIKKEPASAPYFYRYMGSKEFVQNIPRWFLFCNRIPETERAKMPMVIQKLKEVSEYRRASKSEQTYKLADTPEKFHFENVPTTNYLAIPQTSSGKRRYVPIGFLGPEVLANNKLQIMTGGGLYEFGILSSNIHNAWVRTVVLSDALSPEPTTI